MNNLVMAYDSQQKNSEKPTVTGVNLRGLLMSVINLY